MKWKYNFCVFIFYLKNAQNARKTHNIPCLSASRATFNTLKFAKKTACGLMAEIATRRYGLNVYKY